MHCVTLSSLVIPTISLLFLALAPLRSNAQLVGCSSTRCPETVSGQAVCTIGNTTNNAIGIVSLNTTISPAAPLTWTLGVTATGADPSNSSLEVYLRTFYLASPKSLGLATATPPTSGCALFFNGQTTSLQFPHDAAFGLDNVEGTCSDAMGANCVGELIDQATELLPYLITQADSNQTSVCLALEQALQANVGMTKCAAASRGTWGRIAAKEITGPLTPGTEIALASGPNACQPTTGGSNYDLSMVDVDSAAIDGYDEHISPYIYGVTPIMTVFYDPNTNATAGVLPVPEVYLSCLKSMNATGSDVISTSGAGGLQALTAGMFITVLVALAGFADQIIF